MAYTLTPTNDLVNHTKSFEGFMPNQYPDVIGNAIGYGNHYYYPNGVEGGAVLIPPDYGPITEQEAHNLCVQALTDCMIWTDRTINKAIKADLKQNQFEALACIVYAMGPGGFKGTSLFKAVNADPNNLVAIKNGFINAHQHKERLMMEYNYYETGKLACKAGYVPPSSSSGTSTASTASDAVSKDSARQIRYFNTNYCNSIICDGELVNAGGTSGSNSGGDGSSGGGGSTGKTPVSKPENNKDGTVVGNQAANALTAAYANGYRLWNWKCDGFELNGLTDTVKFSAIICKGNNNVGGLTVKIGAKKQYILYLKPNSLEVAPQMYDNTTNINQQQTSIQTPTKVTTMSYNDTIRILSDKANLNDLEKFHLIIVNAKKTNIEWERLENIFNEQPTNSSDTKKLSMFDVLYTHFKGLNQYKRIDDQPNYALLCNICKKTINDEGVKAFFKKGLVYFTNINNNCNCVGKDVYFGNTGSAIVIIYPSGKIVRFRVGKNRGLNAGWDDIHMIRK